jgi:hypothetical protein
VWGDASTPGIVPACGPGTTVLRADGQAVAPGEPVLAGDRVTGCEGELVVVDTATGRLVYDGA